MLAYQREAVAHGQNHHIGFRVLGHHVVEQPEGLGLCIAVIARISDMSRPQHIVGYQQATGSSKSFAQRIKRRIIAFVAVKENHIHALRLHLRQQLKGIAYYRLYLFAVR